MPRTTVRVACAAPATDAQARALFQKAEVHFNLGEFEQALALYSEAYRLKPLPGFLFNIAQCHRFMEHFEDAAFSFRVYLDRAPQASNRAEVESLIAQMERQAAQTPAPSTSDLAPPPAASNPPPASPPSPPMGGAVKPSPPPPPIEATARSPWFWPTIGGGAVLLGAGIITGQMASNRSATYRDPNTAVGQRRDLKDAGESLATASLICLGAGGVALAAAAGLWLWAPAMTETAQVAAAPVPGGSLLMMSGAF